MGLETLLELIQDYSALDKSLIIRAYEFASICHKRQFRKSGEPYIIHPLAVGIILAEMHADADTICAGLLHDVLEDCKHISKEYIAEIFNPTIANLVDGLTKLEKINYNNDKTLTDAANRRKTIESIVSDIRIFIIRLADRLHNTRTEDFQPPHKQIEHSKENRNLFIPFARLIGAYNIMLELEDRSFRYLDLKAYQAMEDLIKNISETYEEEKERLLIEVSQMLNSNNIPFNIKTRIKSPYELYRKLSTHGSIDKIHDLYAFKIILQNVDDCYRVKNNLEIMYDTIIKGKSKDYIKNPKTNMYRSIHTSIVTPNNHNFQFQIKTKEMYKINAYGLTAYWRLLQNQNSKEIVERMQQDIKSMPFYSILEELSFLDVSNESYNQEIDNNLLVQKIYVSTINGEIKELPVDSTPIDFAYKIDDDIGNNIIAAKVNGEYVDLNYKLKTKDVIEIIYDKNLIGPRVDYLPMCKTEHAKRKILEFRNQEFKKVD